MSKNTYRKQLALSIIGRRDKVDALIKRNVSDPILVDKKLKDLKKLHYQRDYKGK